MSISLVSKFFRRVKVKDGILSLSGRVVQVIWYKDSIGRPFNPPVMETWVAPDLRNARVNFLNMAERFN